MTCPDAELLHASLDGELDPVQALEVERHLQSCPACAQARDEAQALSDSLRASLPRFSPPAGLRRRVLAALPRQRGLRWRAVALAASLLLLAGGAGLAAFWMARPSPDAVARQVLDSHIRSQLVESHLLDVESDDKHTVKPWFQGKLDFAPSVPDLSEAGFVLAGGRLDFVDGRAVAALVYRKRKHVLNLLVWPAGPGEKEAGRRDEARHGYNLASWRHAGMNWWAVSDLPPGELAALGRLLGAGE